MTGALETCARSSMAEDGAETKKRACKQGTRFPFRNF